MSPSRIEQINFMQKCWHVDISPFPEATEIPEDEMASLSSDRCVAALQQSLQFDNFLVNQVCLEAACVLFPEEQSFCPRHEFIEHLSILSLRIQLKDRELYQHSLEVLTITRLFLQALHLPEEISSLIQIAALFHDVGKIDISHEILYKSSELTPQEFEEVKKHSFHGAQRLGRSEILQEAAVLVHHNHEHWDGSGYPAGLQGLSIPLGSRIIAIADAFTVITTGRIYKPPCTLAQALAELSCCAGTQFDPLLVAHFCSYLQSALYQQAVQFPPAHKSRPGAA